MQRRKEIYLILFPETEEGVSQAKGMNKALGHDVTDTVSATFTTDTSTATGKNKRTIERQVQIGKELSGVADQSTHSHRLHLWST